MSAEQNRAGLAAAVMAWNDGDGEAYLRLYDPSVRHHGLGPEPLDHAGNRAFYEGVWAAFPGIRLTLDDLVAEGDRVAVRFHLSGRHCGDFMGVPPTGRDVVITGQTVLRFRGGRVIERWTTTDQLGLMVQLGAVPAPGG
ncbi:MAG TPA: ester cyclase [Pseudonocardia sp.]|jgi:predicted ester cyclase|uniref:ester cyclase n=1 Tax=Pseudonocardia sp. TaxID=60912 RepID=UPI002B4B8B82|nr:ester cyclase [Pseudonocardia sp.]HLU55543.1 ester cyclase [Pseudonocardia sp.]